ncbi:MAG TPA: hypothetical protein VEV42_07850 [Pyrinomonadaceae bacterium]|nr:hypothetical protein [Pyrinomonadaceae bacterium]
MPCLGKRHLLAELLEEFDAEFGFELFDPYRNAGLTKVHFFAGTRVVQVFGYT